MFGLEEGDCRGGSGVIVAGGIGRVHSFLLEDPLEHGHPRSAPSLRERGDDAGVVQERGGGGGISIERTKCQKHDENNRSQRIETFRKWPHTTRIQ